MVRLVSLKSTGRIHRVWSHARPTPVPGAFFIPPCTPVVEASGERWASDYPVVAIFWPRTYYQVFLLLKAEATDVYANIITPPFIGRDVTFIDLELDVIRKDGHVDVIDEEDFQRSERTYPDEWVRGAEEAVQHLVRELTEEKGIFRPATLAWWRDWSSTHCK